MDKLPDGTPLNVAVYKAYRNAGLSHNQALAITAEVGRENSFQSSVLFASHTDPAGRLGGGTIRNVGMLSWNQGRDIQALNYLARAGVINNGRMIPSQENLNAQAAFSVAEMRSPRYANRLRTFWSNPNASPEAFAPEIGKNYIGWAYGQDTIRGKVPGTRVPFNWQKHDARRRSYLNQLSQAFGGQRYTPSTQQGYQQPTFQDPTAGMDSFQLVAYLRKANKRLTDNQIFEMLANNPGVAGREVRSLLATGQLDPRDIAKTLGLKKTSFAPEVTTYFDNLKKPNPAKAAQPIRQPSKFAQAFDSAFTANSQPQEAPKKSKFESAIEDYFNNPSVATTQNATTETEAPPKRSSFADAFEQAFTQTLAQPTDKPTEKSQVPQVQAQPQIKPQPQPTQQATPTLQTPSLSTFVSAKQPTLESDLGTDTTTTNNNDYANNVIRFGLQA